MKYITKILIILSVILLSNFFYGVKISNADDSVGDTMEGANSFIEDGEKQIKKGQVINNDKNDPESLQNVSDYIYNLLLAIGIIMAVAIGSVLGIKFMISSVEEQAKIKELLVPYVAGCIVIFGAFGIWKIAVNVFKAF
ncbi:MAG: hypothetical protein IKF97_01440 [Clostridia bacterium]|nr:hypothetical protein [Clostridia bacterium]